MTDSQAKRLAMAQLRLMSLASISAKYRSAAVMVRSIKHLLPPNLQSVCVEHLERQAAATARSHKDLKAAYQEVLPRVLNGEVV